MTGFIKFAEERIMTDFIKQEFIPCVRKEKPLWELSKTKTLKTSNCYIVRVNGVAVPVYSNMFFSFANIVVADFHCPVQVEIIAKKNYTNAVIRPLDHEEITEIGDRNITIVFSKEGRIVFEPDGILTDVLYILVSRYIPCPAHCSYKFEKGHIYNIGHLKLQSGDVMYIESGAIVSGTIESSHADNLLITGNGILYNGNWHKEEENGGEQMMLFTVGNNIQIEGITLLDGGSWHLVPVGCNNVQIHNVNILGKVITGDGIDIVGSSNVKIEDSFIRVNDDCISIKGSSHWDASGTNDVRNVIVRNCLFWNAEFGNALEIGYETACDDISDIHFENCRILHCEYEGNQSGGCLTIHDADHADVHDVHYENIVIEDAQEKFIDLKVLDSKYSSDRTRGHIFDIHFSNISVVGDNFPVSIIRGFEMKDELSRPAEIYFHNIKICGTKITGFREMHLISELADNLYFS